MKKAFLALGVACMIGLASCSESVDSQLDKFEKLTEQFTEATKNAMDSSNGPSSEQIKLGNEIKDLTEKLENEKLTEAQQERYTDLKVKFAQQTMGVIAE